MAQQRARQKSCEKSESKSCSGCADPWVGITSALQECHCRSWVSAALDSVESVILPERIFTTERAAFHVMTNIVRMNLPLRDYPRVCLAITIACGLTHVSSRTNSRVFT